jgi:hypothetical protein
MIPVKKITITRAEGLTELCGRPMEFPSFTDAKIWLMLQDETYPKHGGYDKHDFKVEFEDGETYEGRLDCQHSSCKYPDQDVKEHIAHHVRWMSGREANPWCGMEQYLKDMRTVAPETKKEYSDFLDKYLTEG